MKGQEAERSIEKMRKELGEKRVLVTGACGTVGSEIVKQLLTVYKAGELIGIDNSESELFFMLQRYESLGNAFFYLGDIRDRDKLKKVMQGVDIVFHAAAFKHVILCEYSPFEAVQTNILGVRNIILSARANNVQRVIFTSSDKAVNPTNVMGTSKLMGERLMTAAHSKGSDQGGIFASTRFGNVLGSRGSVIPIFQQQIASGGPMTLTDPEMTRFIMSIEQAVQLVIDSSALAQGGEVFVTKMPVIRIKDLMEVMIEELAPHYGRKPEDIKINIIGSKPGEKLYEELMTDEETRRAVELPSYFVVKPAFSTYYDAIPHHYESAISTNVEKAYNSATEEVLSKAELRNFLYDNKLLNFENGNSE